MAELGMMTCKAEGWYTTGAIEGSNFVASTFGSENRPSNRGNVGMPLQMLGRYGIHFLDGKNPTTSWQTRVV